MQFECSVCVSTLHRQALLRLYEDESLVDSLISEKAPSDFMFAT